MHTLRDCITIHMTSLLFIYSNGLEADFIQSFISLKMGKLVKKVKEKVVKKTANIKGKRINNQKTQKEVLARQKACKQKLRNSTEDPTEDLVVGQPLPKQTRLT